MHELFTGLSSQDIIKQRPSLLALFSDSLASAEPLRDLINRHFDEVLMQTVAAEHRRGRRLFIGTTHVYAGRLMEISSAAGRETRSKTRAGYELVGTGRGFEAVTRVMTGRPQLPWPWSAICFQVWPLSGDR